MTIKDQEKQSWVLSDSFRITGNTKPPYPPKVGEMVNNWTILGAWVSSYGCLKAYKALCSCGHIGEYLDVSSVKHRKSKRCIKCRALAPQKPRKSSKSVLTERYGLTISSILLKRYYAARGRAKMPGHPGMCKEWQENSVAFCDYIVRIDGVLDDSLETDRINTYKGYEPGNVRFITQKENMRNKKTTIYIEYNETKVPLVRFIEDEFGVECSTKLRSYVYTCYCKGWTAQRIIDSVHLHKNAFFNRNTGKPT